MEASNANYVDDISKRKPTV